MLFELGKRRLFISSTQAKPNKLQHIAIRFNCMFRRLQKKIAPTL